MSPISSLPLHRTRLRRGIRERGQVRTRNASAGIVSTFARNHLCVPYRLRLCIYFSSPVTLANVDVFRVRPTTYHRSVVSTCYWRETGREHPSAQLRARVRPAFYIGVDLLPVGFPALVTPP